MPSVFCTARSREPRERGSRACVFPFFLYVPLFACIAVFFLLFLLYCEGEGIETFVLNNNGIECRVMRKVSTAENEGENPGL